MSDTVRTDGVQELQFHLGQGRRSQREVARLLRTGAKFSPSTSLGPAVPVITGSMAQRGVRGRGQGAPPFASISLGPGGPSTVIKGTRMPLFLVASASEVPKKRGKKAAASSVAASPAESSVPAPTNPPPPAWRVAAGNLAAGAVSGCAVEAALYPIDTIKTRLQAMIGGGGLRALLESGGGKGLYAGVWGNLAGVAPASAIFISVYEPVKKAVEERVSADQHYLGSLVAGMAAGSASSLVRVPTEVIKQRLQTKEFPGAISAIRAILAKEGARGLYAGYGAFMLRDLPFDAIEFVAYEQLKIRGTAWLGRDLAPHETSVIGAVAGGFTGLVTTPLDVLKTRLMTQGANGRYANLVDATVKILREEGAAAFLKGWQPRLFWISLGGFVFFPVLEATKKAFAPQPLAA